MCLSVPIVFSTGISNYLKLTAPDLAIAINPFHGDAFVNDIVGRLSLPDAENNLDQIRTQSRRLTVIAPTDARGYSLVGETYLRAGEANRAKRLFETALRFSKTEINALQRSYGFLLQDGQITAALDRLDLISRRWPNRFSPFVATIPFVLSTTEGYDKALDLLTQRPPWRRQFLAALNRDPDTLDLANRLLLDLHRLEGEADPAEVGRTMQALIQAKRYNLAHRLFLFTQSEIDQANNGYVFNATFATQPSNRPFDWSLRDNAAVKIRWINDVQRQAGRLQIRFLGKPAKSLGISQYLRLPPGSFTFAVSFSGTRLKLPKGLYLELRCTDPGLAVARIAFPEAKSINQTLSEPFRVDADDCGLYQIRIVTDLIAESFRYRYGGTLNLHDVRIDRSPS